MNPEVKEKWLKALRSGEYIQARAALRNKDSYCCLGVLCDLYRKEVGGEWIEEYTNFDQTFIAEGISESYFLPLQVQEWAGLSSHRGWESSDREDSLADMNDTGRSFEEIAQVIEREL